MRIRSISRLQFKRGQKMPTNKVYLGDAVYAEIEGGKIKLTTDYDDTAVYLHPNTYNALLCYVENNLVGSEVMDLSSPKDILQGLLPNGRHNDD
jgi:hypothetical protein